MFPGKILTSALKRVDVATYKSFMDAKNGAWTAGVQVLGLKEVGVDYSYDEYNKALIPPETKAVVDAAKADIISGKIQVHDYMSDNKCPV
jgi:basic membrane protein A